jgi:hypothetical protein
MVSAAIGRPFIKGAFLILFALSFVLRQFRQLFQLVAPILVAQNEQTVSNTLEVINYAILFLIVLFVLMYMTGMDPDDTFFMKANDDFLSSDSENIKNFSIWRIHSVILKILGNVVLITTCNVILASAINGLLMSASTLQVQLVLLLTFILFITYLSCLFDILLSPYITSQNEKKKRGGGGKTKKRDDDDMFNT